METSVLAAINVSTLAMGVTFVTEMSDYYIYNHKRPDIISQNMNDLKTKNA